MNGKIKVTGSVIDASPASVTVNGVKATLDARGLYWSAEIPAQPGMLMITAKALDAKGNAEQTPHTIMVSVQ